MASALESQFIGSAAGSVPIWGGGFNEPGRSQRISSQKIAVFSETDADVVSALTMNYVEAIVETDGRLSTGQTLKDAIEAVDEVTDRAAAYFNDTLVCRERNGRF
jgi:hypothetical protein